MCDTGHSLADSEDGAFDHSWSARDNFGNPVYENTFIYRTLDKALTDFAAAPEATRFVFVLPVWNTAPWWPLTKHFRTLETYPTGSVLFSAPAIGVYNTSALTSAGADGSPGRYLVEGTPWPVVVLYKDRFTTSTIDPALLLHMRLGHPGELAIKHLATYDVGLNVNARSSSCGRHCAVCFKSKSIRQPAYPSSAVYAINARFQLIFSDIHGPLNVDSPDGHRYMVAFTDAATRYVKVYFMQTRDQAASYFALFLAFVESLGFTVKSLVLRTDNDTVYVGSNMEAVCEAAGVRTETTAPYRHTNAAHGHYSHSFVNIGHGP